MLNTRLLTSLAALLVAAPLWAATPTEVGTRSILDVTSSTTNISFSHTVASGTTQLVLLIGIEGAESVSTGPIWDSVGVNESFGAAKADSAPPANNNNARVLIYVLDSPTVKTANITLSHASSVNPAVYIAVNVQDSDAWSGNFTNTVDNSSPQTTTTVLSGGSCFGTYYLSFSVFQGADGALSEQSGGTELVDGTTGSSSNADFAYNLSERTGSCSSSVTWSATADQNGGAGVSLEEASAPPRVQTPRR